MNTTDRTKIFIFDKEMREKIALLSCMPSCLTKLYAPALDGVWATHLASALVEPQSSSVVKPVSVETGNIEKIHVELSQLFNEETYKEISASIINAPMLIGNRFALEQFIEEKEIPDNLISIIESHRKRILWIEKGLYEQLYNSVEYGTEISFDPYRVAADEENVNSMVYLLQFMPWKRRTE